MKLLLELRQFMLPDVEFPRRGADLTLTGSETLHGSHSNSRQWRKHSLSTELLTAAGLHNPLTPALEQATELKTRLFFTSPAVFSCCA